MPKKPKFEKIVDDNDLVELKPVGDHVAGASSQGKGAAPPQPPTMSKSDELPIQEGKRGQLLDIVGDLLEEHRRGAASRFHRKLVIGSMTLLTGGLAALLYFVPNWHLVEDGNLGLSLHNGRAKVYGPGHHQLLSPLNKHWEKVSVNDKHISKGQLHIITVGEDEFGLAFEQGAPLMLGPGIHIIDNPFFVFTQHVKQTTPVISHGTFHRVIIGEGFRGLAMEGNRPMILESGIYTRISPLFEFKKSAAIDDQRVQLSPFSIITVHQSQVGIAYNRGQLSILKPGEHWLNAQENQLFLSMLPTTEQVKALATIDILTSDGLMVRVSGSVSFRIADPFKAVNTIGCEGDHLDKESKDLTSLLFDTVMQRCNDTLASLLTGTDALSCAGLGFGTHMTNDQENPDRIAAEEKINNAKEMSKKHLNEQISKDFRQSLFKVLYNSWGVELTGMQVVDIDVIDVAVRKALAQGVRANVEAVTERRNAEARAETARILAAGERDAANMRTDATKYNIEEVAKSQKLAGDLLAQTPVAVQLRLAETAAGAFANGRSNLLVAKDASSQTLMKLIGAGAAILKDHNGTAEQGDGAAADNDSDSDSE